MVQLDTPTVLVCGSRRWSDRPLIWHVLDRLAARYGDDLVVVEGLARGADRDAHTWCQRQRLGPDRHRCYPVDWDEVRRTRPHDWKLAGHDRNTAMFAAEHPRLVIACHQRLDPHLCRGGTADSVLKAVLLGIPTYHILGRLPTRQPSTPGRLAIAGRMVAPDILRAVPGWRQARARDDLTRAGLLARQSRSLGRQTTTEPRTVE